MKRRSKKPVVRKKITARAAKTKKIGAFELWALLMDAVAAEYSKDPTRAGLVSAKLPDGYYVSIVRYREAYGNGRTIVTHEKGETLDGALRMIAERWHKLVTPPPTIDLLKKLGSALK